RDKRGPPGARYSPAPAPRFLHPKDSRRTVARRRCSFGRPSAVWHGFEERDGGGLREDVFDVVSELGRFDDAALHEAGRVRSQDDLPAAALDLLLHGLPGRLVLDEIAQMMEANGKSALRQDLVVDLRARAFGTNEAVDRAVDPGHLEPHAAAFRQLS